VKRADIYERIDAERVRQGLLWTRDHGWGYGDCSSTDVPVIVKVAVLTEECGEVASAVLEGDEPGIRAELIEIAAVAVAWLESM